MLRGSRNLMAKMDVENILYFEMMNHRHPEVVLEVVDNHHQRKPEMRSELILYLEMDLNRGSELRTDFRNS